MLSLGKHDQNMCFLSANMTNMFSVGKRVQKYVFSALVLSFWVPSLGSRFWADSAHGPWPIGPVCVASRLAYYVLHQCLETMCCIALRRRWSCMTHHDDDHYHHDHDHHRRSWQTCAKKSEGLGRVGFHFSKFEAPLDYCPLISLLAILGSCSPGRLAGAGWPRVLT